MSNHTDPEEFEAPPAPGETKPRKMWRAHCREQNLTHEGKTRAEVIRKIDAHRNVAIAEPTHGRSSAGPDLVGQDCSACGAPASKAWHGAASFEIRGETLFLCAACQRLSEPRILEKVGERRASGSVP